MYATYLSTAILTTFNLYNTSILKYTSILCILCQVKLDIQSKTWHYFVKKVRLVKAMVFPVVMYGCENWSINKAECWRIDAFELWCWRRLLRVPWTARRPTQSILKEISPGCSLEGLILNLKLQYLATWCEELTHLKRPWCWERLRAGGEGDDRGWDGWMASLTRWTWVWVDSGSWWWTGRPGVLWFMGLQRVGHYWVTKLNWTELIPIELLILSNHLTLCWLLLLLLSIFPSIRVFSN